MTKKIIKKAKPKAKSRQSSKKAQVITKEQVDNEESDEENGDNDKKNTRKTVKKVKKEAVDQEFTPELDSNNNDLTSTKSKSKNKPTIKNNKILSTDPNEDEDDNQSTKSSDLYRDTDYRNYWLEVYLEKEGIWISVDPFMKKFNKSSEFEERFGKRILYVCGFDNDNRVKDVTKRYAEEWATTTRVLRISNCPGEKFWWDKMMLRHQMLDAYLDIEEEKQLKSEFLFIIFD